MDFNVYFLWLQFGKTLFYWQNHRGQVEVNLLFVWNGLLNHLEYFLFTFVLVLFLVFVLFYVHKGDCQTISFNKQFLQSRSFKIKLSVITKTCSKHTVLFSVISLCLHFKLPFWKDRANTGLYPPGVNSNPDQLDQSELNIEILHS